MGVLVLYRPCPIVVPERKVVSHQRRQPLTTARTTLVQVLYLHIIQHTTITIMTKFQGHIHFFDIKSSLPGQSA
jgi:hypothetical protein